MAVRKSPGNIFVFGLSSGKRAYAQWLADETARVFLRESEDLLTVSEVLASPTAFRVMVYKDTPSRYGWSKIGSAPVPTEFLLAQQYVKRDAISGRLSLYCEGVERSATAIELQGLETCAVWAHPHIVERLEAQLSGRESEFLKSMQVAI